MSIYKACDTRGDAATELSAGLYRRWGRSLGCRLEPGAPFVVGGDVRPSTAAFLNALAGGLCEAGVRVLEMGVAPTPMVYFARRHLGVPACAIVTASHNPPRGAGESAPAQILLQRLCIFQKDIIFCAPCKQPLSFMAILEEAA